MYNFGVYADTNTFIFDSSKPIVLIGGMNGRGKTTFLEAILLALYGKNSIAYKESKYKSYGSYLRSYVYKYGWEQRTYIELEFENDEGSLKNYIVHREWDALSKRTKEAISVKEDGEYSQFLTQNWPMFVESILPSALSSFYFFDGEKIAELAVDSTNNQMKQSIRSMLGITVLDTLKNDLNKETRKALRAARGKEGIEELNLIRSKRDAAKSKLSSIDDKIIQTEEQIKAIDLQNEQLNEKYTIQGGEAFERRQEILKRQSELQVALKNTETELLSDASAALPLLLVKDLLGDIKLQAEDEHNDFVMRQSLMLMDQYLEDYKRERDHEGLEGREFLDFVKQKIEEENVETLYQLSDHAIFQVTSLLEHTLEDEKNNTQKKIEDKRKIKKELKKIDSHLSLDINEEELNKIQKQLKANGETLIQLKSSLAQLKKSRVEINVEYMAKSSEFNNNVEKYIQNVESLDEADRKIRYTDIALKLIDRYMVELQKRKTSVLGETITDCYKKLANKKHLIQSIEMDPETLDIKYYDEGRHPVDKNSLSAGEKQLMVVSILWALAICSRKKLPVIIDTPLSRLDSLHRRALITTYFPAASDQTIILSTDSEINRDYYNMMKKDIGSEFTLLYNEERKCTVVKTGYFEDNNDSKASKSISTI